MREIENALVVGVRVDGGHEALFDAEIVVKDFCDRCKAVGGTRGVGDDVVGYRIIFFIVYAEYHGEVCFFAWGTD